MKFCHIAVHVKQYVDDMIVLLITQAIQPIKTRALPDYLNIQHNILIIKTMQGTFVIKVIQKFR